MSTHRVFITLLLLGSGIILNSAQAARVGVAPFSGAALSPDEARVARSLLVHDLQKARPADLVMELRPEPLMAQAPVLELMQEARGAGVDELVLISTDRLGGKLMLQLRLLETQGEQNLLTDALPVAAVEDLDVAMERVAEAIAQRQPVAESRQVGKVLENEGLNTRRRTAIRQTTLQAGYLWPIGQDGDSGQGRKFTASMSSGMEERNFDAGYSLAWRNGPALLLYSDWLMQSRDLCPFVGGAAGFHWSRFKESSGDYDLDDGLHTSARAGLILYRTYQFQIVLQTEYAVTWNDHQDRAWHFSLGIRP